MTSEDRISSFNIREKYQESEPTLKILVVDNDRCMLKLFKFMLGRWGMNFDLICIDNSADAANYLKDNFTDILIVALNLNGVDGRELIRYTRGNIRHQGVNIVAMSGMTDNEFDSAAGVPDDVDLILKPIDFRKVKLLAEYCGYQKKQLVSRKAQDAHTHNMVGLCSQLPAGSGATRLVGPGQDGADL